MKTTTKDEKRCYVQKLINNKKRNSKYCNKTLSITDFEMNK